MKNIILFIVLSIISVNMYAQNYCHSAEADHILRRANVAMNELRTVESYDRAIGEFLKLLVLIPDCFDVYHNLYVLYSKKAKLIKQEGQSNTSYFSALNSAENYLKVCLAMNAPNSEELKNQLAQLEFTREGVTCSGCSYRDFLDEANSYLSQGDRKLADRFYQLHKLISRDSKREQAERDFELKYNNIDPAKIEMVYVKGGTFQMGCTSEQSDCHNDEKPAHSVTVSSFNIGKYEVTQAQWQAVMGSNPSSFKDCPNCPVESVSWDDVQEFIKKLNAMTGKNYRLPTEAEWEYAARGGESYEYSGNSNVDAVAWYADNSDDKTHVVGRKQPNAYGIYDMSGNVEEYCSDWYGSYSSSSQTNPTGPSSGYLRIGSPRVLRGGGQNDKATDCRVANRGIFFSDDSYSYYYYGFRLVLP